MSPGIFILSLSALGAISDEKKSTSTRPCPTGKPAKEGDHGRFESARLHTNHMNHTSYQLPGMIYDKHI